MSDPRVGTIRSGFSAAVRYPDSGASIALHNLAREAQLARAVVEAAEGRDYGKPSGLLLLDKAIVAYRSEFPQEPSA